jgi:hypothetical protein
MMEEARPRRRPRTWEGVDHEEASSQRQQQPASLGRPASATIEAPSGSGSGSSGGSSGMPRALVAVTRRSAALCCCVWLLVAMWGPTTAQCFLQPPSLPPPAAAGSRAWLPQARDGAFLATGGRPRRPGRSPFLQASPVLAAEPTRAAEASAASSEEGEEEGGGVASGSAAALAASAGPPVSFAEGEDKAALFAALESHMRRKEAFEVLWNSDMEFDEEEYQELLKACFRLGYGACRACWWCGPYARTHA